MTLALDCEGRLITTIEDLGRSEALHSVQQSFIKHGAIQRGLCTPGVFVSTKALLGENPAPKDDEIKEALSGVFCRCTGHVKTVEAVRAAASFINKGNGDDRES